MDQEKTTFLMWTNLKWISTTENCRDWLGALSGFQAFHFCHQIRPRLQSRRVSGYGLTTASQLHSARGASNVQCMSPCLGKVYNCFAKRETYSFRVHGSPFPAETIGIVTSDFGNQAVSGKYRAIYI
jgi:hypothetical protein